MEIEKEWIEKYNNMDKWCGEYLKEYMKLRYHVIEKNDATSLQIEKFNYMRLKKPKKSNNYCKKIWKGPKTTGLKINKGSWIIDFNE